MRAPGANAAENFTPNQVPNSCASVSARQTRERGACSRTFLVMVSVLTTVDICNLQVAHATATLKEMQPFGCIMALAEGCRPHAILLCRVLFRNTEDVQPQSRLMLLTLGFS